MNVIIYGNENKVKWYNVSQIVGTFLLFWPPLGVSAYTSDTIKPKWRKVVSGDLPLVSILF